MTRTRYRINGKEVSRAAFLKRRGGLGVPMVSRAYEKPLVSVSCGVHPEEVDAAREEAREAGLTGVDFDKDGMARFSSREQRRRYLKFRGYRDNDGGYGDG